ncbi:hypothetical protein HPB48_018471 [Haemaphysalis longicornis]|uniref:Reverse transcriptase domain-containing protein n=1 Tax=Haemaphysalis longicornis TaxID=44386 RepID=A0A9J6GB27_HAELO|nr:hypothetical protein HPB48_018471 [Haemaphysalis longicornis]
MDAPFLMNEHKAAINTCKGFKTPGPGQITTPALRNLSDADQEFLLEKINDISTGKIPLPEEWKTGQMIFIPKPGKPITTTNLRPITLISNAGKLLERMALRRLQEHLEDTHHLAFGPNCRPRTPCCPYMKMSQRIAAWRNSKSSWQWTYRKHLIT